MRGYHLNRGTPRCAFKVDIQKAYDTLNWNFLEEILICFGYPKKMIKWIMACVTSTSYFICVNSDLHGFFKGKRGLRQGDPLSPYLFTLVMEVLSLMLKRNVSMSNGFLYHPRWHKMNIINLCFADDLFIFSYGNMASVIKKSLTEFKESSGLSASLPKSTVFFANVMQLL
ncbi:secreted RxLR effector protein 78-like [Rutidosis leptorrhynchoides]|uniref:secreted RxLR effector protein 78-like n=1 Tax=Rutidosis leptorrhynchoides TaxID=125765 RepID=UPI003A9A334F